MEADQNSIILKAKRSVSIRKMQEFYINDNNSNKKRFRHRDNSIDTTKYSILTFLPKALLYQFMRFANIYFLIIAIIQSIPIISPLSSLTAIAPIAFVLFVSLIREGIEDYARHQYDKLLNNESVLVFREGLLVETTSGSLKIGEIIVVRENDPLPADVILLDSDMDEGTAFIETATLDGEKTLKSKIANKNTAGFFNRNGDIKRHFNVEGYCICDLPNSELYKIEGNLELTLSDTQTNLNFKVPLENKQMLLKGAILKNTKWILAFVVYTGRNTKLILNSKKPRVKYSRVENLMSKMLVNILFLQMIICIVCAVLHDNYYTEIVQYNPYIPPPLNNSTTFDSFITYFTYMLLLNTMIPISLIITLEIVKLIQGYFTRVDVELFSHVRGKYAKVGSISLNEELGQVDYIFSDKTGTLTCNQMQFKYCVIGDMCYEYNKNLTLKKSNDMCTNTNINLNLHKFTDDDSRLRDDNIKQFGMYYMYDWITHAGMLSKPNTLNHFNQHSQFNVINRTKYNNFYIRSEQNPECKIRMDNEYLVMEEYWKALSLAHECSSKVNEDDTVEYTGLSPDDIELVKTAAEQGFKMLKSSQTDVRKVRIGREDKEFRVLKVIEFNSDRKRMSIIVKDGEMIKLYSKGADSEIKIRLSKSSRNDFADQASTYVDLFSAKGFRTLLVAMKVIDPIYYEEWEKRLMQCELDLGNKQESVDQCYADIENDLYLLGATVVEDKLQDQVPETIRDLRLAGIKVWMLTGDKMNTAYNIGLSCNLISKSLKIFSVSGEKGETLKKLYEEFSQFCNYYNNSHNGNGSENGSQISLIASHPFSVIIDAIALASILKTKDNVKQFLDIARQSTSVICCRVTPLQKSEVVRIMKNYNPKAVTLSIGDGGNDVSMIMEAHIGVGVYGEEGMRAVQASDFAIGEFRLLRRLLMFHGRINNIRISEMILYFFFKNFVFTILHFFYGFYNNFSGQTIIDDWFISLYNMIFTALPLGVTALSDFDVVPEDGFVVDRMMPFLYKENRNSPIFTKLHFLFSLIRGIVFGVIVFYFTISSLEESSVDSSGNISDLWFLSGNLFTVIIFMVSFRLIIAQRHFIWPIPVIMVLTSWLSYFTFVVFAHFSDSNNSHATMEVLLGSGKFYLNLTLPIVITVVIDQAINSYQILFNDSISGLLMVERKLKGVLDDINDMPEVIRDAYKKYALYDALDVNVHLNNEFYPVKKSNEKVSPAISDIMNDVKSYSKSNRDVHSQKVSQDLLLMEAPYNKKISEDFEKRKSLLKHVPGSGNEEMKMLENSSLIQDRNRSNIPLISNESSSVVSQLNKKETDNGPVIIKKHLTVVPRVPLSMKDDLENHNK